MINFRFHLVSIVAVFLALAVGIVMGYGVLSQPTVDALRHRIDTVEANAEARRHENDALKNEIEGLDAATVALGPFALTGRFPTSPVLVVAERGLDGDAMSNLVQLARRGGADVPGILWLEESWNLTSADKRKALATAVDTTATKNATVRDRGVRALVDRLASGPGIATDLLRALTNAGFVSYEAIGNAGDRPLAQIGGPGLSVVFVVGTHAAVPASQLVVPFAREAVSTQMALVVGEVYAQVESGPGRGSLVSGVRGDEGLKKQVSTIDDMDRPSGPVAALLALSDLVSRGTVGQYGFGEGATPVPPWWNP